MKLAKGTLKLIAHNPEAAKSNNSRARAGSKRLKPVWRVFVLNDDGKSFSEYNAYNFRASSLFPRHEPLGLRQAYPFANTAMRRALEDGVWFETRSEMTLVTEQEVPDVEDDLPPLRPLTAADAKFQVPASPAETAAINAALKINNEETKTDG